MYSRYIKRILDLVLSLITIIILSPLFLILTIIGAIMMKGNPFFIQERPGLHGKIFKLIKFRTMSSERDADGNLLPDIYRLNRYGKILRASSLDELPELINIIKGDMSIVGPRPLLVCYLERYNDYQRHRHDVRPGLTGWAQVNGRNTVSWEKRFELDIWYIQHISFLLDLRIILMTIKNVILHEGISSETSVTMEEFMGGQDK